MGQTTLSHIRTKGWHCDVTDEQIDRARKSLKALFGNNANIYYTEEPDPYTAKRYFWMTLDWDKHLELGCFDHYGNLVIYSASLVMKTRATHKAS